MMQDLRTANLIKAQSRRVAMTVMFGVGIPAWTPCMTSPTALLAFTKARG